MPKFMSGACVQPIYLRFMVSHIKICHVMVPEVVVGVRVECRMVNAITIIKLKVPCFIITITKQVKPTVEIFIELLNTVG